MSTPQRQVIRWEEPPAPRGGRRDTGWAQVAAQLRDHPREWALVEDGVATSSLSNHISRAKISDFDPPGAYEAVARRENGSHRIYARYVGVKTDDHAVELEAAIERVRQLHSQDTSLLQEGAWCPGCGETVPCPTIRALNG